MEEVVDLPLQFLRRLFIVVDDIFEELLRILLQSLGSVAVDELLLREPQLFDLLRTVLWIEALKLQRELPEVFDAAHIMAAVLIIHIKNLQINILSNGK